MSAHKLFIAIAIFISAMYMARAQPSNDVAPDSVIFMPDSPGNVFTIGSRFVITGRFRNRGMSTQQNVPVELRIFRGATMLETRTGNAFPISTPANGTSLVMFEPPISTASIPGLYTVRAISRMISPLDQNPFNDTLNVSFTIRQSAGIEVENVATPSGYRSPEGQYSEADYVMADSLVPVIGIFRNTGDVALAGETVHLTVELLSGTSWTVVSTSQQTADFSPSETKLINFGTIAPRTLREAGMNDAFHGASPNVTPVYRLRLSASSPGSNTTEKLVRFYVRRSHRAAVVTVENYVSAMPADAVGKSNKLNADTLLAALNLIGWKRSDATGQRDYDLFERNKWPVQGLNLLPWQTVIWVQGGEPQGLEPAERTALKIMLDSGRDCHLRNLIIVGQDIARIHDVAVTATNGQVADPGFVRNYLRGEYRGNTNPVDYNNRAIWGVAPAAEQYDRIQATGVAGDKSPTPAVMRLVPGEGSVRPLHYYANQEFLGYTDSVAVVASSSPRRNVVFHAIDMRHYARFNAGPGVVGAQNMLQASLNFINASSAYSSGPVITFTLRWNTKKTDLDLVLVRPDGSTIYWGNRKIGNDSLDGDDHNGEGPEDIVYQAPCAGMPGLIRLGVTYSGPTTGADTKATIFVKVGSGPSIRLGTCMLEPGNWWDLGSFDPMAPGGLASRNSTCGRPPAPFDVPRKKVTSTRR